ncbi:sulfatase-like hydrolase/transferase [Edaphobacter sp.]|uniref:sulfatase-like hydrolase/transferase n=1 Tax=Edaphobacter sp. TaxID=1934404 RepID=UPI002DBC668A|nr:sulfatase-like hydrolase/transferase [Edaphobacter sp.]HEU5340178.1 sulfatase-like hydrolase/transferase [Edaphobacter sp.]
MRLLTHPVTTALGLTEIYLLGITGQLISARHDILYHWAGSSSGLILPMLLDFSLLWIVLTLLLLLAQRPNRLGAAIWTALAVPIPWVFCRNWTILTGQRLPLWTNALLCGAGLAILLFVLTSWKPRFVPAFERTRRLLSTALGFVSVVAILVVGQILWLGWKARDLNTKMALRSPAQSTGEHTRIIWVLFDELSYRQVYERRFPGLELPAFDHLAAQSTLFTHTIPAGKMTENVIPSLLTSEPVDSIKASIDGRHLALHNPDTRQWTPFDPRQTVFEDALNNGYSTAIAGWYNPYCRILPQVLDQCFWSFNFPSLGGISPAHSLVENTLNPLRHALASALSLVDQLRGVPTHNAQASSLHILDYTALNSDADRLLQDRSASFVFLHMPIPHPGGIYDRATGDLTTTQSTYIDNLALADRYLAHVRSLLEQNGTWDSSIIVVMGDHSWRTSFLWKPMPSWTPEEQRASDGGRFDSRPVYIVKLPHQHQPERIDLPYAAIHTRALLDALMDRRIESPGDLSAWAAMWNAPAAQPAIASAN